MPRQQRGANWRGLRLPVARRYIPDMGWNVTVVAGANVTLDLYGITGQIQIVGFPDVTTVGGQTCHSAGFIQPNHLDLQFDAPVGDAPVLIYPPLDESVRSSTGAYVAPATIPYFTIYGPVPEVETPSSFGPLLPQRVNVPINTGGSTDLPAGTAGQWVVCTQPGAYIADWTIDPAGLNVTLHPGDTARFQHNGVTWVQL